MNFDRQSFHLNIAIKSDPVTIYNAWASPLEIVKWFLQTCEYTDSKGSMIPEKYSATAGSKYKWTWYLYDGIECGTVLLANGSNHFRFSFAGDCIVDITLEKKNEYTLLNLHQFNIPDTEDALFKIRMGCLEGWTFYLANLKCYYETGHDLRNKTEGLRGLNN